MDMLCLAGAGQVFGIHHKGYGYGEKQGSGGPGAESGAEAGRIP